MFSNAEMDRRWRLVRAAMASEDYDWLIGSTGHPWGFARWLTDRAGFGGPLVAVPLEGDIIFAAHGDELHTKAVQSYGIHHVVSPSQLGQLVNSHAGLLVKEMRAKPPKKIGLLSTGFIPLATYEIIRNAFPDAIIADATELITPIKARRSAEEMVCMRRAAEMHDQAIEVVRNTLRAGITPKDVMEEVRYAVNKMGSASQSVMAGSAAPGTPCLYFGPNNRVIDPGDQFAMLIECSETSGYYSETFVTACLGDVPKELTAVFNDVVEAQEMLVAMVRPGIMPSELLKANAEFMGARGYPAETRLLGHAQGVDLVERPCFSPLGETLPVEADTVISIHPTTHTDKAWGFARNVSFFVTGNGIERMLKTPQEIMVI
jgi:Xaa-Pro aminopeptidase